MTTHPHIPDPRTADLIEALASTGGQTVEAVIADLTRTGKPLAEAAQAEADRLMYGAAYAG